jgi:serine/threonine-protein kinase
MTVERQATLLDRLRDIELLSPAQLEELAKLPEASDPDPRALGRVLLQRKLLTRFQVTQAALGKGKELRVGKFLLLDKLGEGGMGQVYRAKDTRMGRLVALKLMRKEKLAKPDSVKRFYQEIQAASQLNHPNIVIAYDADQVGNLHYFSMELVDGIDLAQQVRQSGVLPVALACEYVRQAAVGLQHAHEKGLVHRDIKPANLLVANNAGTPQVKILDLGLARLQGKEETGLTRAGQVLGTPDYLAPEQAFDSRKADVRSDVYSLGCTLYFLLTGQAPFLGETLTQVLLKHQMKEAIPLTRRRPDVSAGLAAVVQKMMAKAPDDRYQSAAEAAEALAPFARGAAAPRSPDTRTAPAAPAAESDDDWSTLAGDEEPVMIRTTPPPARTETDYPEPDEVRPRRRRRQREISRPNRTAVYVLIGVGAAIPVLTVMILGLVFLARPPKFRRVTVQGKPASVKTTFEPKREVQPPDPDPGPQPAVGPEQSAIFDVIEDAVRAGKTARTAGAPLLPAGTDPFVEIPREGGLLTGLELGLGTFNRQDVVQSIRGIYQTRQGRYRGRRFGPELSRVVTVEAKPGYAIGELSVRAGAGLDAVTVMFMAIEGRRLNVSRSYRSEQVGGNGGNAPVPISSSGAPVVGIFGRLWGGNAGQLGLVIASDAPGQARSSDKPDNQPREGPGNLTRPEPRPIVLMADAFLGHDGVVNALACWRSGKLLASGGADRTVRVWDAGGRELKRYTGLRGAISSVGFSGNGQRVIACDTTGAVQVWDLYSARTIRASKPAKSDTPAHACVIVPDGSAYILSRGKSLSMSRLLGNNLTRSITVRAEIRALACSADSRILAIGDDEGSVRLAAPDSLKATALPNPHEGQVLALAFSPDGTALVSAGADKVLFLRDKETGRVRKFEGHTAAVHAVDISADGKWILSGSKDTTVRLWEAATGRQVEVYNGHDSLPQSQFEVRAWA